MKFGTHPLIGLWVRDLPRTSHLDDVIKSQEQWHPGNENEINDEKSSALLCKNILVTTVRWFPVFTAVIRFSLRLYRFFTTPSPSSPSLCGARALQRGREGRAQGRARFSPPSFGPPPSLCSIFFLCIDKPLRPIRRKKPAFKSETRPMAARRRRSVC